MPKPKAVPIIYMRIAWMKQYQGVKPKDIPVNGGAYIDENAEGGEVGCFKPFKGSYYGYVQLNRDRQIAITRLGAKHKDDAVDGITVVFVATPPKGGVVVVGWYTHATVYRPMQDYPIGHGDNFYKYNVKTEWANAFLIPSANRDFAMPKNKPGTTNIWYADKSEDQDFVDKTYDYISSYKRELRRRKTSIATARQPDIEKRRKVEWAAMENTADHYTRLGYTISDVHKQNLGWDLEAQNDFETLLLEVKGLSGTFGTVELSPNEYAQSKLEDFRLCVVSKVLTHTPILNIFHYDRSLKQWIDENDAIVMDTPKTSALFQATAG